MKIRGFDLTRAQHGWVCDVAFAVFTVNQCSAEEHAVRSGGRWFVTAMWNGWMAAHREAARIGATPSQRSACGW